MKQLKDSSLIAGFCLLIVGLLGVRFDEMALIISCFIAGNALIIIFIIVIDKLTE